MILASDIYELVLDLARKDLRGFSLSAEEYNRVARVVNNMLFLKMYKEFESSQENSEAMSHFKVLNEPVAVGVGGIGALPADFYHLCGMPWYSDTGGVARRLDLVTSLEHAKRQIDYLTQATLTNPTFRFGIATATSDMTLYVTPTAGINPIYIDYIREPATPFLDYYIDSITAGYTWMAAGATVAVPVTAISRTGVSGANVDSATENWEYYEDDIPIISALFLEELGVQLPDNILYEGGSLKENKLEA